MKPMYLESALEPHSFYISIGIKIMFFRVSFTIEPGRFLLTVRYDELFDYPSKSKQRSIDRFFCVNKSIPFIKLYRFIKYNYTNRKGFSTKLRRSLKFKLPSTHLSTLYSLNKSLFGKITFFNCKFS